MGILRALAQPALGILACASQAQAQEPIIQIGDGIKQRGRGSSFGGQVEQQNSSLLPCIAIAPYALQNTGRGAIDCPGVRRGLGKADRPRQRFLRGIWIEWVSSDENLHGPGDLIGRPDLFRRPFGKLHQRIMDLRFVGDGGAKAA